GRPRRSRSQPRKSKSRTGPWSVSFELYPIPRCFRRTAEARFDSDPPRVFVTQSRPGTLPAKWLGPRAQPADPLPPPRPAAAPAPTRRRCRPQALNRGTWVLRAEDGSAGHEHIGAGLSAAFDRLLGHSAVDLQPDLAAMAGDEIARAPHLGQHQIEEALA